MAPLALYLLTLNCARLPQPPALLTSTLASTLPTSPPSLVFFSLQELAPLAPSFLGGAYLDAFVAPFVSAMAAATSTLYDISYEQVAFHHVGMTAILAFAPPPSSSNSSAITHVRTGGVGVGPLGLGNKGAAALALRVGGEPVVAVAAHFAPDEFQAAQRDADWVAIVRGVVFEEDTELGDALAAIDANEPGTDASTALLQNESRIWASGVHLFVLGDLNYRTADVRPTPKDREELNGGGSDSEGEGEGEGEGGSGADEWPSPGTAAGDDKLASLWEHDQLHVRQRTGLTLQGMQEAPVDFPPTYKYSLPSFSSSSSSSSSSSYSAKLEPRRWPSWTDRILFLPTPGLKTGKYGAVIEYATSDHRPVFLHATIEPGQDGPVPACPFDKDHAWRAKYDAARRVEQVVGATLLAAGSWSFWGAVAVLGVAAVGAWGAWKSVVEL